MTTVTVTNRIDRGAVFGPGGPEASEFRYLLWRSDTPEPLFGGAPAVNRRRLGFVLLNSSTADHERDDPTIRRCVGFGKALGFNVVEIGNLFALRSTDPRGLAAVADPIGPANDEHLLALASRAEMVICAWGSHGRFLGRGDAVLRLLRGAGVKPHALQLTKGGAPGHPLYLRGDAKPFPLEEARRG